MANEGKPNRVVLHPGDYYVTDRPAIVSTLLGSCIAVCLYDPVRHLMGMNHFLLPDRRFLNKMPADDIKSGLYGSQAMTLLLDQLLRSGAERRYLKAKAFGGGNVLGKACQQEQSPLCVGSANVRFVRDYLQQTRIPLVAEDLGGNQGRQIHFSSDQYAVYLRRIPASQSTAVVKVERGILQNRVQQQSTR